MIRFQERSVVIENLTVSNPEVFLFLQSQAEKTGEGAGLDDCVVRCIQLGALALERADSAGSVDFMRKEVEAMLERLNQEFAKQVGVGKGQVLEPVQRKVEEVAGLLKQDFDPRNPESFLASLRNLLDPHRKDSVQGRLDEAIRGLADRDKPLSTSLRGMIEDALKPVLERLQGLEGKKVLEQDSVLKGRAFEDEVEADLGAWSQRGHAEFERVSGDNDTGDFVVLMRDPVQPDRVFKVAIEAKDDQKELGRKRLADNVRKVLGVRQADAAIWLCKTQAGLAQEVGEWADGMLEDGRRWTACTVEHLHAAMRWAWVQWRLDGARKEQRGLDVGEVRSKAQGIRDSLKRIREINAAAGTIRTEADNVLNVAGDLKKQIEQHLSQIEAELKKAGPRDEPSAEAA